jgi:AcrR family transcriptional regulator
MRDSTPPPSSEPADAAEAAEAPRRVRDATATKRRIVDAAQDEFAARGFQGARLREIAQQAGVQTALIHHYFGDKRGLYRSALEGALEPTSATSWTLLASVRTLDEVVSGFVDLLIDLYAKHRTLLAMLRHEMASGSGLLDEAMRRTTQPIVEHMVKLIERLQGAGDVRSDVEPIEMIVAAMSAIVFPFADEHTISAVVPGSVPHDDEALARRRRALRRLLVSAFQGPRAAERRES